VIDLDDPYALLFAAVDELTRAGLEHAVYGGLALAVYGEPRETKDADLAVANLSIEAVRLALEQIGATVVVAFTNTQFGGLLISRLTLLGGGKLNMVDLVKPRSERYASLALSRTLRGELEGHDIRVMAPEDFVLFKVLSTREKDVEDARSVLASVGDELDRQLIEAEVALLAAEIPSHDISGRWHRVTAT
jgi:hypothetical protein